MLPAMRSFYRKSLELWRRRVTRRERLLADALKRGDAKMATRRRAQIATAKGKVAKREKQVSASTPKRLKAWAAAGHLVGIMEQGGNNAGAGVAKIITGGGGQPSARPPWCGYFVAYCYRLAGSKVPDWRWGAVRLLLGAGLIRTKDPLTGDVVRFKWDHTGLFGHWCDVGGATVARGMATHFLTREGNASPHGAVSDSKTGGDGVYEKVHPIADAQDFLKLATS